MNRCQWCETSDLMRAYHDTEWGVPVHDDKKHFEFMLLDTFQAGLSWATILNKRENFRKAFDNFDARKIVNYDEEKISELMQNAGIIRNKLKSIITTTHIDTTFLITGLETTTLFVMLSLHTSPNKMIIEKTTNQNTHTETHSVLLRIRYQ